MDYITLSLDITLNRLGYKQEDITEMFQEPFDTLYSTRIGYQWQPSAVGWDAVVIVVAISAALKSVADGFLNQIGADLATWSKDALSKVLNRKKDFDNSAIHIKFNDKDISIHLNRGDEIVEAMKEIEALIRYLQTSEEYCDKKINLYFEDIKKLEKYRM